MLVEKEQEEAALLVILPARVHTILLISQKCRALSAIICPDELLALDQELILLLYAGAQPPRELGAIVQLHLWLSLLLQQAKQLIFCKFILAV